jgi:FMN-dependent NADH-azoreductase
VARQLAEKLASGAGASLTVRDLTRQPLPHIDDSFALARNIPRDSLTSAQKSVLALSDELLRELFAADTLIIAAGMINFGVPSSLKAYIDHVVRPGVTFRYGEKGPEGLVKGTKAYLVVACGGVYSQGPMQAFNFQDTYLKVALGFIGITDIELIAVEGVAFGPEAAQKAVSSALAQVEAIA